jgi:hypothetical protein
MMRAIFGCVVSLLLMMPGSVRAQARGDGFPNEYKDLPALVKRADAVVRGAIVSEPRPRQPEGALELEVYDVAVSEIFKDGDKLKTGTMSIAMMKSSLGARGPNQRSFVPMAKGGEYVLFLVWYPRANLYVVLNQEAGMFQIDRGKVETASNTALATEQRARSRDELLTELRAIAGTKSR